MNCTNRDALSSFQTISGLISLSQRERAGVRENLPSEMPWSQCVFEKKEGAS
jgi:hypothetical protein